MQRLSSDQGRLVERGRNPNNEQLGTEEVTVISTVDHSVIKFFRGAF